MLVVPLFEVSVPQPAGKSVAIITGCQVDPCLRRVAQSELGKLKNSLRSHKPRDFRSLRPERQPHVHRGIPVFEEHWMHVGSIPSILPAVNSAKSRRSLGSLIDPQNKLHATEQMNQQVSRQTGPVFLPTAPAGE